MKSKLQITVCMYFRRATLGGEIIFYVQPQCMKYYHCRENSGAQHSVDYHWCSWRSPDNTSHYYHAVCEEGHENPQAKTSCS